MEQAIIYFLISFAIALVCAPIVIKVLRRLRAGQSILHYVDFHAAKSGTPTMGGIIFILPLMLLSVFILGSESPLSFVVVIASFSYALLGFLDDYIKIKTKNNLGLRAYQKIIGQGGIALIVSIFYYVANPHGQVLLPFANTFVNIGFAILPLTFIAIIATVNSVNLTDGLDGLAATVSMFYLAFLTAIILFVSRLTDGIESEKFVLIASVTCGALLCYLLFNTHKAVVFMGDTGSLYLGSIIALLSIFSFLSFYVIILGAMFVLSSVSDIIQVIYFKLTGGKRVFLMAPFHHHLEKKGWTEGKIVFMYATVTIIAGLFCVLSFM